MQVPSNSTALVCTPKEQTSIYNGLLNESLLKIHTYHSKFLYICCDQRISMLSFPLSYPNNLISVKLPVLNRHLPIFVRDATRTTDEPTGSVYNMIKQYEGLD